MQTAINKQQHEAIPFNSRASNWISIRLLNVYRLGLAAIFFAQSFFDPSPLLTVINLSLYSWVSSIFLILSLIWIIAANIERRGFEQQVSLQIYCDTFLIILLMHACGGISSGLGMLLIISMAATSMLGKQSLALIFASLASLGLLAEYIYSVINISGYSDNSTQVGILGVALFATAITTHKLTLSLHSSEKLVQQKERDVAMLSALNQQIIENLQAGVIVVTTDGTIRHINNTASQMLNIDADALTSLEHNLPKIATALKKWHQSTPKQISFLPPETGIDNLQISFRRLYSDTEEITLIFLDDISLLKNSMQQSKLASLGHLTANIAHEIRNPLAAISHAAQLLVENKALDKTDERMAEIIYQHTRRINHIIEDVLKISRGTPTISATIDLHLWLPEFIKRFCLSIETDNNRFNLDIQVKSAIILFDNGHLDQIMTNLCNNARIHGVPNKPIHIKVHQHQPQAISLEIADEGPGIDALKRDEIFEPFYTTSHQGSGLGLYIVNQLCELNNATIRAYENSYSGTSFCIYPNSAPTAQPSFRTNN